MFRINYGYGVAKKGYTTLKGARIACASFCKRSGGYRLDIVEMRNGRIHCHHEYLRK